MGYGLRVKPVGREARRLRRVHPAERLTRESCTGDRLGGARCELPQFQVRLREAVMAHRALRTIGQEAIQLHGGIGMTDEYAVSHYVKRLLAIEIELGGVDTALMRFAAAA